MFTYAQEIIGLKEEIKKEIDLSVADLSASKLSFSDPDFTATNTEDAIKEVDLKIADLSASQIPFTDPDFTATNTKDAIVEAKSSGGAEIIPKINIVNNRGYQGFTVKYYANKDDADPTDTQTFGYSSYNTNDVLLNYQGSGFSLHGDAGASGNMTMTLDDVIGVLNGSYYFEKDSKVLLFSGNDDANINIYIKGLF